MNRYRYTLVIEFESSEDIDSQRQSIAESASINVENLMLNKTIKLLHEKLEDCAHVEGYRPVH